MNFTSFQFQNPRASQDEDNNQQTPIYDLQTWYQTHTSPPFVYRLRMKAKPQLHLSLHGLRIVYIHSL